MPVREGKMSCSTCHNPHGSISNVKALRVGSSVHEACTTCHTEMRGPVLWEHAPVRENCATCHDPHGSSNDRMLNVRHADALPALSRRHAASGVDLRQQRDYGEQEQPDVRALVRELPFEHPRVESSIRPVLHEVGRPIMRVLSLLSLVTSLACLPDGGGGTDAGTASADAAAQTPPAPTPVIRPRPAGTTGRLRSRRSRSLFDPAPRQFQIGGRLSSVSGDPARWQRYEDLRDGLLFTDARYERLWEDTGQLFRASADKVGWRDQRFTGLFERPGLFRVSGFWDEIPQFYSVDTTHGIHVGRARRADDARRDPVGNPERSGEPECVCADFAAVRPAGAARHRAWRSSRSPPSPNLDLSTTYRMQRHVGELPWGASFGFSNDVEVPLPYNSRANDFDHRRRMDQPAPHAARGLRRVVVRQPRRHARLGQPAAPRRCGVELPGRGRMSLWPSNQAQTVSFGGFTKLSRRTQLTGFVSYGVWTNDSTLQPFTINAALPTLPLPRADDGGRGARLLDQSQPGVAADGQLAAERAAARLRLRQRDPARGHPAVRQLRLGT